MVGRPNAVWASRDERGVHRRLVPEAAAVHQIGRPGGADVGVVEPLEHGLDVLREVLEVHVVDRVGERLADAERPRRAKARAVLDVALLTAVPPVDRRDLVLRPGPVPVAMDAAHTGVTDGNAAHAFVGGSFPRSISSWSAGAQARRDRPLEHRGLHRVDDRENELAAHRISLRGRRRPLGDAPRRSEPSRRVSPRSMAQGDAPARGDAMSTAQCVDAIEAARCPGATGAGPRRSSSAGTAPTMVGLVPGAGGQRLDRRPQRGLVAGPDRRSRGRRAGLHGRSLAVRAGQRPPGRRHRQGAPALRRGPRPGGRRAVGAVPAAGDRGRRSVGLAADRRPPARLGEKYAGLRILR